MLRRAIARPGFRWTFCVRGFGLRAPAIRRALGGAHVRVAHGLPNDAQVVWFPWNGTFWDTPIPAVATLHDATPFVHPAPSPRIRRNEQVPFRLSAERSKHILVQSRFTASEVERWLGVAPERITVVPLAVDEAFSPGPCAPPAALQGRRYILYVGAHDERKNSRVIAEAFARAFPAARAGLAPSAAPLLVFTERPAWPLPPNVVVVPRPNDDDLVALYRGAAIVVVPSTYEGFGLPLLEALACAVPVAAAHAGALPEVGGEAVRWVNEPLEVAAWESALRALAGDATEAARLRALGPAQAARFSWDRCTTQTLEVLREVALRYSR